MKTLLAPLLAFTILSATGTAHAQLSSAQTAARRRLLDRAFEADTRGDHSEALALAEEAAALQMTPSLRMFLAQQHEVLSRGPEGDDHLVEAATHAGACVREATEQVTLNNRVTIMQTCAEVFDRLNPRVGRVRLQVPRPAPTGLRIRVNDREIPERDWNDLVGVLPGPVTVEATAPSRGPIRRSLTASAGRIESVALVFPVVPVTVTRESGVPVTRVVGLTLLGIGVVAGAVGIWQAVVTSAQADASRNGTGDDGMAFRNYNDDVNPRRTLTASDVCSLAASQRDRSTDAANAANMCDANSTAQMFAWAFGIGGLALAAGGAVLTALSFALGPRHKSMVELAPLLGTGVGGATMRVGF